MERLLFGVSFEDVQRGQSNCVWENVPRRLKNIFSAERT